MEYTIVVRSNMLSPRYKDIPNAGKILVSRHPQTNRLAAFIDTFDKANNCGMVVGLREGDKEVPMAVLEQIIDKGTPYTCTGTNAVLNAQGMYEIKLDVRQAVKTVSNLSAIVQKKGRTIKDAPEEVRNAMQRTIDEGIYTLEEAEKRFNLMADNYVDSYVMTRVFDWAQKYDLPISEPKAFYQEESKDSKIMSKALMYALQKRPVIYSGSKSVGKNVCAETTAWLLGMPYYSVTFSKKTSVSDIAGDKSTRQTELSQLSVADLVELQKTDPVKAQAIISKGQTVELVNVEGPLVECARVGGFLQVNEDNLLDANTKAAVINPLIDGSAYIELPGLERVYIHPRFIYTASRNPGYEGTCQDNKATMSRCGCINFPYPKDITKMLKTGLEKWGIDDSIYDKVNQFYQKAYASVMSDGGVMDNGLSDDVLNIRGLKNALEVWAAFPESTSLAETIQDFVCGWLDPDSSNTMKTVLESVFGTRKARGISH